MKTLIGTKLAAVVFSLAAMTTPALAGKGGSNTKIVAAVQSGSVDAIIAELERAESLICEPCIQTVLALTEDSRLAVREAAAWWFAKRPGAKAIMVAQMKDDLAIAGSVGVRNAADFLGYVRQYDALPQLRAAMGRAELSAEAKVAIVRAVGYMAHLRGNDILEAAMRDGDASVRVAAVTSWRDILGQLSVVPVVPMLSDADPQVRAEAATVVGAYGERAGRPVLEQLVVSDPDPFVRRNAAWALGRIGSAESFAALSTAVNDSSGIVRGFAKAALASLR
jgi:HEAT repeat protein